MDNFGLVLILVLIILIFISAFFSGSETSITAINQIKLDSAAESGQKAARRVNSLRNKINEVLGVILIGNNLVNISASALLTYFVIKEFGDEYVWVGTLILTILVIIFAEIAQKKFKIMHHMLQNQFFFLNFKKLFVVIKAVQSSPHFRFP